MWFICGFFYRFEGSLFSLKLIDQFGYSLFISIDVEKKISLSKQKNSKQNQNQGKSEHLLFVNI